MPIMIVDSSTFRLYTTFIMQRSIQEKEPGILSEIVWIPYKMIKFRKQSDSMDCGVACLAMIMSCFEKQPNVNQI